MSDNSVFELNRSAIYTTVFFPHGFGTSFLASDFSTSIPSKVYRTTSEFEIIGFLELHSLILQKLHH